MSRASRDSNLTSYDAELIEIVRVSSVEFDRAVLTVSSAALGFSIALSQSLHAPLHGELLLMASWVAFGAAVLSTMVSYRVAARSAFRELELRRTDRPNNGGPERNLWRPWIERLNWCSTVLLPMGFALMAVFASCNLE